MSNIFIKIYDYFASHRGVMWAILITLIAVMSVGVTRLSYDEDITNFFPEQQQDISNTISSLKQSNRLVIFVNAEGTDGVDEYDLVDRAEELIASFEQDSLLMESVVLTPRVDEAMIDSLTQFIYSHLPSLLDEEDWQRIESLCTTEVRESKMTENFERVTSAMGGYIRDYIYRDPLGIGSPKLKELEILGGDFNYNLVDG